MTSTRRLMNCMLKKVLALSFILCVKSYACAQNLVPNPSFEDYTICPFTYDGICAGYAPPWMCGSLGTVDYYNVCSTGIMGVPFNALGNQYAHTGNAYTGIVMKHSNANWREYLMIQLTQPLVANTWYTLTYYVSLAETTCGTEHFGAYFSPTSPFVPITSALPLTPQIESDYGFIDDTANWVLITGCYQAQGGEEYLLIGNFRNDANTFLNPICATNLESYYYIDDVSLIEGLNQEVLDLDLGGPEFACFSYDIVPETNGLYFTWSDGSYAPSLTVTESGTYALTVSDGCNEVIDSIEVTIAGVNPPVEIGPPDLVLCNGDSYDISLDPDLSTYEWNDGTTGPDYSITTEGTYTVTFDDGCSVTTDQIVVSIVNPPSPIDLGDDGPLCDGFVITYNFDPLEGEYLWQDNSTSPTYTITGGGIYSLTVSNMCGEETDEITVMDLEAPEIDLGSPVVQLCAGNAYNIEFDPDLGEFQWQDGSSASDYYITSSGHYALTVTNVCGFGSDFVDVQYIDPPVFDLGPDQLACPGDTIHLNAGGTTGIYTWQDQSTDTVYHVLQSGTYILVVTNPCGTHTDSIDVQYSMPLTPPDFGPDFSLCPGETAVLRATAAGASYLWNDGSTADTLAVNAGGSYYVTVFNNCTSYSDTVSVSINANPPQVDLPAAITLCQGQSVLLDAMITGVSYQWNDQSQNQQLIVNTPGTYSVTVSNSCGSDADSILIADGGPPPHVELGNNLSLCAGDTILLNPTSGNVTSWLWQDGTTGSDFTITMPGTIHVDATNACGTASDTIQVGLLPAIPALNLGPDTSLCTGASITIDVTTPGVNILWQDGSTASSFTASGPALISATISNTCGMVSDTLEIVELPDLPLLNLGPDQTLCPGEVVTITPGISNADYLWQDGSTNSSYSAAQEESIILIISNACSTSTDTMEIIESTDGPMIDLGPDIQVCDGQMVTIPSGISGVNYLWQDGSTGPNYTTNQSEQIILQVSNNCGTDSDTVQVDISGVTPVIDLGPDTTLCEGTSILLMSNVSAGTDILWQDGSTSTTYIVNSPGVYILSASNHCGNDTDSVSVNYSDAPDPFVLGPDTTLCPGQSILLTAPSAAFDIQWQDGSHQSTMVADKAQTYSLQLSNDCGMASDEFLLEYDTRIAHLDLDPSILWCQGDVINLDATQPFAAEYLWSTGSTAPTLQITSPGVYSIDVSTLCNNASQVVEVIPSADCDVITIHTEVQIPNVFSPNGDGINDLFGISFGQDIDIVSMQGTVYDRWGNMVFNSESVPFVWDGYFKNEKVMPGVYVYRIECRYIAAGVSREEIFTGDVTVIR